MAFLQLNQCLFDCVKIKKLLSLMGNQEKLSVKDEIE